MEDTDEFKWAVKVVIKRQMRDLVTQLQESGEEVAILSVNLEEESCALFGSQTGEWFLSEQKKLSNSFLNFCKTKAKRNETESVQEESVEDEFPPPSPMMEDSGPPTPTSSSQQTPVATRSVQKADGTSTSSKMKKKATPGRKPRSLAKEPDPARMQVTIPADLAPNSTEEELACLVGRVFAAKVVAGKLNDHATKFDDMMDAITNKELAGQGKRTSSAMSTPRSKKIKLEKGESTSKSRTRSGRKVSSKFQESINSLKTKRELAASDEPEDVDNVSDEDYIGEDKEKSKEYWDSLPPHPDILADDCRLTDRVKLDVLTKPWGDNKYLFNFPMRSVVKSLHPRKLVTRGYSIDVHFTSPALQISIEDLNLLEEICDLDPAALKRFHVYTSDGVAVNVMRWAFAPTAELETAAVPLMKAIHKATLGIVILDLKNVKITVTKDETVRRVKVKLGEAKDSKANVISEQWLESDDENELESTVDDGDDDSDSDYEDSQGAGVIRTSSRPKEAKGVSYGAMATSFGRLVRKPKKRSATELMLMKCEQCGISVTGKSNLKSHIRRIHLHVRNYTCTICGKGFWSNNGRESHMLAVHTRKCEACQEYVVESVPWGKGVSMKTKRDVICTCGSIVSIYSTFGRRRMYLRDDEPDEEGNFRRSRSKSNAGTKYACGTCGKLFMKKSNCERHSRAHTDMKLCVCDICGSSYSYESSLKKHMQTEHGVVKHVCEICGGNYSNLTALKVHMVKTHHNVAIGDNVAIVVQTKGEDVDEDLEEIEESLNSKEMENQAQREAMIMKEHSVTVSRGDGSQKGQVYIQTPSGEHLLVSTSDNSILQGHSDGEGGIMVRAGQVEVEGEELQLDEGGAHQQVVISTEDGEMVSEERTQEIVQEVLRSGQLMAQEGGMSIIIKQVPMDTTELQNV